MHTAKVTILNLTDYKVAFLNRYTNYYGKWEQQPTLARIDCRAVPGHEDTVRVSNNNGHGVKASVHYQIGREAGVPFDIEVVKPEHGDNIVTVTSTQRYEIENYTARGPIDVLVKIID